MRPVIQIRNIGKSYKIRHQQGGYVALRDVIMNVLKRPFSFAKEKVKSVAGIGTKENFWALRGITFDINPGEVVGIIGRNGAGKSTLLKILTGITPPTEGEIIMHGKVSSLLEVGTGFHPELTGRENIFLNGAILGMRRADIIKNFDAIVKFAEIERFLDTPVKYYSSGMYVRLAFSVAAHMEPDILVVDEVLAVGDVEFQKKCLGKMEEVTHSSGRTILFVSHNMAAIQSLCKKCAIIENGQLKAFGDTDDIVNQYLSSADTIGTEKKWGEPSGNDIARLVSCRIIGEDDSTLPYAYSNQKFGVEIIYSVLKPDCYPLPNIHFFTNKAETAFISHAEYSEELNRTGTHKAVAWIPANLLNDGTYTIGIALSTMIPLQIHVYERDALSIQIMEDIHISKKNDFNQRIPGVVRPRLEWKQS